jgi:hypothetical protein
MAVDRGEDGQADRGAAAGAQRVDRGQQLFLSVVGSTSRPAMPAKLTRPIRCRRPAPG